ncbi:MAG: chromosomal replication initiator protein DnaA [Burkholderiales bacterium]|nr:chromosomal replication initiator protein DnaA [Pseudomonadota bacterium]MCC7067504.1 chromosomal replication initiator protein DnaA [Burkholderiales bacterium]
MSAFWTHCLDHFERELSAQQFATWFRVLNAEESASTVTVVAPNAFVGKWVRDRYLGTIDSLATAYFGEQRRIQLTVAADKPNVAAAPGSSANTLAQGDVDAPPNAPLADGIRERASAATLAPMAPRDATLNRDFTFDSFVTGKANQLARAAAMQVASNPGDAYNPLFIYGGVGLGKTHLLQAIGNALLQDRPDARVRYIHAERYVSDVVKAYQHKAWDAFKQSYATLDLLLIDDIQFFNNKSSTQEQFFYLFNTLTEAKRQVVMTCDTYPKEMEGIEDRLKSRFSWGLTVQVEPPETEMRVAILLAKAKQADIDLDDQVAFFIAKHIRSNVRELEGGLKRVVAYAGFHRVPITPQVAKEALRDLLAVQSRQISIENIQKTVADYYKIKVSDMHSKKRSRIVARPRQVAMALAKELTSLSLPEIGQNFGGRDHTTVLHACRQIASLRESTPQIQHDFAFLLQVLRS